MTNTNESIWHTKNEVPENQFLVVWKMKNGKIHCGRFDNCYQVFCASASLFVNLSDVREWCYLDNLIAQSQQSESIKAENDRLRKALDIARETLQGIADVVMSYEESGAILANRTAHQALQQITITLEQPKRN